MARKSIGRLGTVGGLNGARMATIVSFGVLARAAWTRWWRRPHRSRSRVLTKTWLSDHRAQGGIAGAVPCHARCLFLRVVFHLNAFLCLSLRDAQHVYFRKSRVWNK